MAGRNRMPRQPEGNRGFYEGPPPPVIHRGPPPVIHRGPPPVIHPAVLEEELQIQHRDLQRILSENRHIVDENVMLQRELTAVKEDIHRLNQNIPKIRSDLDLKTRELIDHELKLEDKIRAVEPLRAEVGHLRSESQKLNGIKKDLSAEVQNLTKEIGRAKSDNKELNALKAEVDGLHKELMEARRAFEYEKKANEEQVEQKQAMEKNLISMAQEIEKLRADHIGADIRSYRLGVGAYGVYNETPETRYAKSGYGDTYASGAWGPYDKHGPPRR